MIILRAPGGHISGISSMENLPKTRVAMWSGPRNISTALMRSFENREDCTVIDEPLYGYYLKSTGSIHPGRDDIIDYGEKSGLSRSSIDRLISKKELFTKTQYGEYAKRL